MREKGRWPEKPESRLRSFHIFFRHIFESKINSGMPNQGLSDLCGSSSAPIRNRGETTMKEETPPHPRNASGRRIGGEQVN